MLFIITCWIVRDGGQMHNSAAGHLGIGFAVGLKVLDRLLIPLRCSVRLLQLLQRVALSHHKTPCDTTHGALVEAHVSTTAGAMSAVQCSSGFDALLGSQIKSLTIAHCASRSSNSDCPVVAAGQVNPVSQRGTCEPHTAPSCVPGAELPASACCCSTNASSQACMQDHQTTVAMRDCCALTPSYHRDLARDKPPYC
jgi:hypothetical protein